MKRWTTLLAVALSACLAGCGGKGTQEAQARPRTNPMEINPGPELLKQLRVGEVQSESIHGTLLVAGRVEADETRMARVSAPLTGRIVELEVLEGQVVKRGQVLATMYSTDLSSAQSDFLKAVSQHRLAERAVSRARQLLDAGVIGSAELQRREAEVQQAYAELSSSRERLVVLGMAREALEKLETSRVVNSVTHIRSSIDGMVLERKVTIGQVVQAAETVFVVADLSRVWLVADVPEQNAGAVEIGKTVEATIPALPNETIRGKLSFVSAIVNPDTRTVRVRMDLPNPKHRFKPAMLANMTLVDGAEKRHVVPAAAVVREGNDDVVYVEKEPNTFVLRRVKLGPEFRNLRVVEEGLDDGERVVLEGAFHLNNERKRRALQGDEGD